MRFAITGYASLDHVLMLDGVPQAGRTTTIVDRPPGAWPRLGGSPAYVAAALVAGGCRDACPVSWVGDDEAGRTYVASLRAGAIPDAGVASVAGARTPIALLAYEPAGGCICLYDPGMPAGLMLSEAQAALVSSADWLCVTVGPPEATRAALRLTGEGAKVCWIVKNDPKAVPADLARELGSRANLIFCSRAEAPHVAAILAEPGQERPGRIVVETLGGAGARVRKDGDEVFVAASPLDISDPTGAGDTFAGGAIASVAHGTTDLSAIADAGHRAARALLETRRLNRLETA